MNTVIAALVMPETITLTIKDESTNPATIGTTPITDSHPNYDEIRRFASIGKSGWHDIPELLNLAAAIEDFGAGLVTVEDGVVLYKGTATHNAMTTRILSMVDEGLSVGPMLRFFENLMQNPSFRAVKELYGFLEVNDLPITDDGCFLAYKMVNRKDDGTLTDTRTGSFDYSVGAPAAEMPRNEVNEDPNQTCEAGLHVCAQGYLGNYSSGGVTILVKVNPADVVAVPTDYNNAKMRTCRHETVCEVNANTRGNVFTSAVFTNKDAERLTSDATLADDDTVMTHAEALVHFDCNAGALRKRLNRGVSAKRVYQDGTEMVQVIEVDTPVADTPVDDTVSFDDAMATLGIDSAALRKRLNRGSTVERVGERVRFINNE